MKSFDFLIIMGIFSFLTSAMEEKNPIRNDLNKLENRNTECNNKILGLKDSTKFSIFHIGDSHVQIGGISEGILQTLKKQNLSSQSVLYFPNTIFTDLHYANITIKTEGNWSGENIRNSLQKTNLGFAGRNFKLEGNGSIHFKQKKEKITNISFYHSNELLSLKENSTTCKLGENFFKTTINYKSCRKKRKVLFTNSTGVIYGICVNERNDLRSYYNLGVSGARFYDYFQSNLFEKQIAALKPSLILFTLGTNDSYFAELDTTRFAKQLDDFLLKIKTASPSSEIILFTTPSTFYEKRKVTNTEFVNTCIKNCCQKMQLPYWDWYEIMGGKNSILIWEENKLVDPDLLHFSFKGYELIGEAFTKALLN